MTRSLTCLAAVLLVTGCSKQQSAPGPKDLTLPDIAIDPAKTQVPAGPLIPGHSFGQTFVAQHNGLSKVEVVVATYTAKLPSGDLVLHLCDYPDIRHEIASVTVPASAIQDNSYIGLQFAPIRNSGAKTYYLYVETHNIPSKYALTVWRSDGDIYAGGRFFVDGHPTDTDSRFRDFYTGPPSAAMDGFLVASRGYGRLYLVQKGRLRWITNAAWLAPHGYASQQPVWLSMYEIRQIPTGPCLVYVPVATIVLIGLCFVALFLFFFFSIYKETWPKRLFVHTSTRKRQFWSHNYKLVLLVSFITLMLLRAPWLLTHPRFWAEEGSTWFSYAYAHSFTRAVLYIYPESGYLNLMANIGGVISSATARFVNLDYAPLSTTIAALAIHVLAIGIILYGKSRLFTSPARAFAGCLIVLFAPASIPEIWMNTINSMSYLGLITLLLLFEDVSQWSTSVKWASRFLSVLCGLSAAYSVALIPLFGFSAFRYKERERRVQCYILVGCLLVQVACVVYSKLLGGGLPNRGTEVAADMSSINVLFWQVMVPALGLSAAQVVFGALGFTGAWLTASFFPHVPDPSVRMVGMFCFLIIVAILCLLLVCGRALNKMLLAAAFLILAVLTCVGSLYSIPASRYAFLPGIIFLFLLLSNIQPGGRIRSLISMIVLAFALGNGMVGYPILPDPNAPKWSEEVGKWRADHSYQLRILPSAWSKRVKIPS